MNLSEIALGAVATVTSVGGRGSFRRRLMELGILPGTRVEVVSVAPLGDPLELLVRGSSISIRRAEAFCIEVGLSSEVEHVASRNEVKGAELATGECARGAP